MEILVDVTPLDPATGTRVTLRAASADDRRMTGLNGVQWWPAIAKKPSLSHAFFEGDFTGALTTGQATLELAMYGLKRQNPNCARFRYAGATINIYAADLGTAWPWPLVFTGTVASFNSAVEKLTLGCGVNVVPFAVSALTQTYAGTGGSEGGADLKGKIKPWTLGSPRNVEPVLLDAVNAVYQISGYGAVQAFDGVFEKGASFGAATADYATYAALVAATIPAGRWASCLAAGMFRLGAPAAGIITADVQGDNVSGFVQKTGAIISRVLANAGIAAANIDSASLTALDTAVPRNISIYLSQQTTIIALVNEMARPCNAAAGVSWLGKLFVTRMGIGTPAITLDAQGRQKPAVLLCDEDDITAPYTRIEMQGARNWRVQTAQEISFFAAIVSVGDYVGATTYREGNVAANQGAQWLYVNPTATAGNAPPTLPTTSNAYWSIYEAQADFANLTGATKPAANATRNVVTYLSTAPTTPVDGDLWVDLSGTFAVFKLRSGGAWVTGANALTVYNTLSGKPIALADISTTESTKLAGIAAGADVTLTNTAAGILNQGGLATKNTVASGDLAVAIGGGNLLKNSSFDIGSALYNGWTPYNNAGASEPTTYALLSSGRTGGQYVQLYCAGNSINTKGIYLSGINSNVFRAGVKYVWSFYARAPTGSNANGVTMALAWNNAPTTSTAVSNPGLTTSWQRYVFALYWAPTATVDTNGFIFLNITGFTGLRCDFDDFQIEEGDVATAYSPLAPGDASSLYYPNGYTVDGLRPAELGANVTLSHVSSGFTGQGALASLGSVAADGAYVTLPARLAPHSTFGAGYLDTRNLAWAGGDVVENLKPAEIGANVTSSHTSSGFTGQGAYATRNYARFGVGTNGTLSEDGTIWITDAQAVTSRGTASAITSQGRLATTDRVNLGSGGGLANQANTLWMYDADVITNQGTATAIAGQGIYATTAPARLAAHPYFGAAYLDSMVIAYPGPGGNVVGNLKPQEAGANVTESRVASSVSGQGTLATRNRVVLQAAEGGLTNQANDTWLLDGHLLNSQIDIAQTNGGINLSRGAYGVGFRATDSRLTGQTFAGGIQQTASVNPLSTYTDSTSATVSITAHTVNFGGALTVSYAAGSISGLALGVTYAIYTDDSSFSGASSYVATTAFSDLTANTGRRLVGYIVTSAATYSYGSSAGGGAGGGGLPAGGDYANNIP